MDLSLWIRPVPRQQARSLDLMRVSVAAILLTHPLHALLHPADAELLARAIAQHGLPLGAGLAWAALGLQSLCSLLLLWNRRVVEACAGHLAVLFGGVWVLHWPDWFVAGGAVTEGHPGAEFSVLLSIALVGVLLSRLPRGSGPAAQELAARHGLDLVRLGAVLVMVVHPMHLAFDPDGVREFGQGLEARGFPAGVLLVCTLTALQLLGTLAFLTRRLVVPGAVGMIVVHTMGMILHHRLRWFAVGPGEEGNEFPALLVASFLAVLLAHWPLAGARAQAPAALRPAQG